MSNKKQQNIINDWLKSEKEYYEIIDDSMVRLDGCFNLIDLVDKTIKAELESIKGEVEDKKLYDDYSSDTTREIILAIINNRLNK